MIREVKDNMIAGNLYQVLEELPGIGREVRWVGEILETPLLYCSSVSVATKES